MALSYGPFPNVPRRALCFVTLTATLPVLVSCSLRWDPIDVSALAAARRGLGQDTVLRERELYPLIDEEEDIDDGSEPRRKKGSIGSAILGELIAIFPGLLAPGLGHYYAGDPRTGGRLLRVGEIGWLLTLAGGGAIVGGLAADDSDLQGTAISLYAGGGVAASFGVTYLLTAWIYDMIDTPRAVLTGLPPPRTPFIESLDIFD